MLIKRKLISLILSLIMTASLFMTQILAAETDDVSGNNLEVTEASEEEGSGEAVSSGESYEEAGGEETEAEAGGEETDPEAGGEIDTAPAMVIIDDSLEQKEPVSSDSLKNVSKTEEGEQEEASEESKEEETQTEAATEAVEEDELYADTDESGEYTEKVRDEDLEPEETAEAASEETEESEKKWRDEHGVKETEDGKLEYTDENGDTWEFEAEDPEMFKRIEDPEYDRQTPIGLKSRGERSAALGEEQDPYSLILNPDFKYRYPEYFLGSSEETLPDVRCGMDISRYQGVISADNWRRLKDEYGIEFAFIRAGYRGYGGSGSLNVDECCTSNIENAYSAGVAVGIYYFSQAVSVGEAEDEADHCLEIIDGYRDMITLPVVTDYEYSGSPGRLRAAELSDAEHTAVVNAFCDRIESAGYLTGIYANKSMLQSDMILSDIPDDHLIWMANFVCDSGAGTYSTSYSGPLCSWQFSSRFTGFGEGGRGLDLMKGVNLDLDLWYGDFPGEEKWVPEETTDEEGGVLIVDADTGETETYNAPEDSYDPDGAGETAGSDYSMSISNTLMTAEDVVYSPRPRSCRSVIRICGNDGSRLAAGFDYDRELYYTYDEDAVVQRRTDMWARQYEEVAVSAGEPVDMKRDVIPVGTVIRVTATGKGRYEDPNPEFNTVSTTFRIIPEREEHEEPVEIEAVTEEGASGKQKRLLSRLVSPD
ncbi:MAG: hypothetical protein K6E34_00455 [Lachnospiraceae bacterium]|nr:hypothetical protein [Lachnospiraceae bacterium]